MVYPTMANFTNETVGALPLLYSVSSAVPIFWPLTLFMLLLLGSASSYFAIFKTTGKKRFWHALTAMSFVCFLLSLLIASMNTAEVILLAGYWIGFYIAMIIISWFLLTVYK